MPHPAYLASLERGLGDAVERAASDLVPVRLHLGSTRVPEGLALNRVYRRVGQPERYDRELVVLRVEPLATVVAFACHAVALGSGERNASADFVAPLRRELEASGGGPLLYLNGCGGDVNPAGMDSRGPQACEDLGRGLARAAREALAGATPLPGAGEGQTVGGLQEWVPLPLQPLRSPEEAATLLAAGRERLAAQAPGSPAYRGTRVTEVEYPLRLLRLHYGSETLPEVQAEVQALKIGPLAVVALPGEIFSSLGVAIKGASPFPAPRTLVAGWANDNIGYVPDADAYALGGYEVDLASRYYGYPAGWAPEAGAALVEAAGRLLQRLAGGEPRTVTGRGGRLVGGAGGQLALPDQLAEGRLARGVAPQDLQQLGRGRRPGLAPAASGALRRADQTGELRAAPALARPAGHQVLVQHLGRLSPAQAQRGEQPFPLRIT